MVEEQQKKNVNSGLISLEIVARFNQIDIDMHSVVRNYGIEKAEISPEELIRIAQDNGFKVKKKCLKVKELVVSNYPTPAIIRKKSISQYICKFFLHFFSFRWSFQTNCVPLPCKSPYLW